MNSCNSILTRLLSGLAATIAMVISLAGLATSAQAGPTCHGQVKLILTGGSYLDLMRRWKLAVFYDQQGHLTTQLGIQHVPALVTQDGKRLRIDELL